jgi:Uma2 family endonuclease
MDKAIVMSQHAPLLTADELEKFPEDDYRYELVDGRLLRMSPVGTTHGRIVVRLITRLNRFVEDRALGVVLTEVGFKLASNPDTVRAPDVAFIRRNRMPSVDVRGFWHGPPDLAIEVLSPEDRPSAIRERVEEYLSRGVTLVLVVDPDAESVAIYRRMVPPITLNDTHDALEIDDVVPGFRCTLSDIFG